MNPLFFFWDHALWYIVFFLVIAGGHQLFSDLFKNRLEKLDLNKAARRQAEQQCRKCGSANLEQYRKVFKPVTDNWQPEALCRICRDCGYELWLESPSGIGSIIELALAMIFVGSVIGFTLLLAHGAPQRLVKEFLALF